MSDASEPLVALRAAAGRLDDLDDRGFDAMEHAARFEDLHGALVAVLADVEQAEQAERTRHAGPERA